MREGAGRRARAEQRTRRALRATLGAALVVAMPFLAPRELRAYPLDGWAETGIARLEAYRLAQEGRVQGRPLPRGARFPTGAITLALADRPDFALPPADAALTRRIVDLLGADAPRYGIAVLDLSDRGQPRYAAHNPTMAFNPGSVGKLLVALGVFQALADVYPDDLDARRRVLRETVAVADGFIVSDGHTVPLWRPGEARVTNRPLREGDRGNLWTWLDWMLSSSSNAAASTMQRELLLLQRFGAMYPVEPERAGAYLGATPKPALTADLARALEAPVTRNGLDLARLRQGSFFTREGKRRVPGTSSHGTAGELMRYLVAMERGRLVDPFSSLAIKRLLYLTDRRIRYASSPALAAAAVYFKSGSWFGCKPEPGFACKKYEGNVRNFMNSVAIVETPDRELPLRYLVVVMSNVLRKNSAVAHQTLATRIHRMMEAAHPIPPPPAPVSARPVPRSTS